MTIVARVELATATIIHQIYSTMIKVFRVLLAVDYKDGRQRELFYSENKERAELKFKKVCGIVQRIADDNGLNVYDIEQSDVWHTFAAADTQDKVYAHAEILVHDVREDFMNLYNYPIF